MRRTWPGICHGVATESREALGTIANERRRVGCRNRGNLNTKVHAHQPFGRMAFPGLVAVIAGRGKRRIQSSICWLLEKDNRR